MLLVVALATNFKKHLQTLNLELLMSKVIKSRWRIKQKIRLYEIYSHDNKKVLNEVSSKRGLHYVVFIPRNKKS